MLQGCISTIKYHIQAGGEAISGIFRCESGTIVRVPLQRRERGFVIVIEGEIVCEKSSFDPSSRSDEGYRFPPKDVVDVVSHRGDSIGEEIRELARSLHLLFLAKDKADRHRSAPPAKSNFILFLTTPTFFGFWSHTFRFHDFLFPPRASK